MTRSLELLTSFCPKSTPKILDDVVKDLFGPLSWCCMVTLFVMVRPGEVPTELSTCALPARLADDFGENTEGTRFGLKTESRWEFTSLPGDVSVKWVLNISLLLPVNHESPPHPQGQPNMTSSSPWKKLLSSSETMDKQQDF